MARLNGSPDRARTQILNAAEDAQFDEQALGPLTSRRAVVEDPELGALL